MMLSCHPSSSHTSSRDLLLNTFKRKKSRMKLKKSSNFSINSSLKLMLELSLMLWLLSWPSLLNSFNLTETCTSSQLENILVSVTKLSTPA